MPRRPPRPAAPRSLLLPLWLPLAGAILAAVPAAAEPGPVPPPERVFVDVAGDPAAGLAYRRAPSPRNDLFDRIKREPVYTLADIARTPIKPHGAPGVALLDFDGDGDLDLYVTNGPGAANSLFENRIVPDGEPVFDDVAVAVGADLTDQDSAGVCFGDTDNDGDPDLLVLGTGEPARFLENLGGTFADRTDGSGLGGGPRSSSSCSMADVDGDGLLDVAVGNTFTDWRQQAAIIAEPFAQNEGNQLFRNLGGNAFEDVSAASGIRALAGVPPGFHSITWAIALVDLDADGDPDLVHADDQAAIPPARYGGLDRGYLQVFENDGTGRFTNRTREASTDETGQWMGLAFGDLDCDGRLDLFGSNLGDWMFTLLPAPYTLGDSSSRWFLQRADGSFDDPQPAARGGLRATPFGWGASTLDYDADGDLDLVFHGGLDAGPFVDASNPGVVLRNTGRCSAVFEWDRDALPTVDHLRRTVEGVAVGDLDLDGRPDVVTVSSADHPPPIPLATFSVLYGSVFDPPIASYVETFVPTGPGTYLWSGIEPADGTLTVELNRPTRVPRHAHRTVTVEPVGTVGVTAEGRVNRSGIGALVSVAPRGRPAVTQPVLGGSSYASQDALAQPFGLGREPRGTVEVLWPGGTRNRLYGARAGERIRFPEIPCSIDGAWSGPAEYAACVRSALDEIVAAGLLEPGERGRFLASALRAFAE